MKSFVLLLLFYSIFATCVAQQRIINGLNARDGEFPYHAQIMYNNHIHCGSAIIHKRWLISAAHCFIKSRFIPFHFIIRVGTLNNSILKEQLYPIEKVIIHEDYFHSMKKASDIVLIRVIRDIQLNSRVQPIKLPKDNTDNFEGALAIITGLGSIRRPSEGMQMPKMLKYTSVRVVKSETCKKYFTQAQDTHLCTYGENGTGVCYGDSGSPVVAKGLLIGIVALLGNSDCDNTVIPNLHVRISSYLDWIKTQMYWHSIKFKSLDFDKILHAYWEGI